MESSENIISRIVYYIDLVGEWSGKIVCWLLIPVMLGICYEVISRYFFNSPTQWAFDLTWMLYSAHFMLGAGYTLLHKEHIRTDMIYEKLSPRRQGLIDSICYLLLFFPSMLFLLYKGLTEAVYSWDIAERASTSGWQPIIYPIKTVVPVAAALLILQGISEFIKSVRAVKRGYWS
jgi:TRAP-type mannitol/chloroaromatic compound transport system permease small subunit